MKTKQGELHASRLIAALALALAGLGSVTPQTYPDKPVHVIVAFTPGSATDVVARAVAQALSARLGQPVIVENKPGAGGTIGAAQVAKAAPDGYTLLVNSSGHTVNPSIYPNLTYDTAKDLMGVSLLAQQPNILVVAPAKGWKTATISSRRPRPQPGKITFASAGAGSGTHMNAEKFKVARRHRRPARALQGHARGAERHDERPGRLFLRAGHRRPPMVRDKR